MILPLIAAASVWILTSTTYGGDIKSVREMPSENICREAICAAKSGLSCADEATMEKADFKAMQDRKAAWLAKHPDRLRFCTQPAPKGQAGFIGGQACGAYCVETGWDGKQCGPEEEGGMTLINNEDVSRRTCTQASR